MYLRGLLKRRFLWLGSIFVIVLSTCSCMSIPQPGSRVTEDEAHVVKPTMLTETAKWANFMVGSDFCQAR
jgi:hypothetical protein